MGNLRDSLKNLESALLDKTAKPECKGVFFRGKVNEFVTEARVARHVEVTMLKRMSCHGCEQCHHFLDDAREGLGWESLYLDNIEHGKLYRAKTVVDSIDTEMGHADSWHTEFQEVKPSKGEGE